MAVGPRAETPGGEAVGERLRALLAQRASGAEAALLAVFARELVRRGEGWVDALGSEDAASLVASAFRFFAAPGPELRVRAVSPTRATDGWDAPVSVIETCLPDRPFVVDTVRETLVAASVAVRAIVHPIFATRRDPAGRLEFLAPPEGSDRRESFVHVAIPRTTDAAALDRLAAAVQGGLEDVCLVTDDFPAMLARAHAIAADLEGLGRVRTGGLAADAAAVADFLRWLVDGAFVFLGYREYQVTTLGGRPHLAIRPGSGLGLLRRESRSGVASPRPLDELPTWVRERLAGPRLLTVTKTLALSPVHRRAHMDDVGVRQLDAEGRTIGERRFVGLFTSKAYAEEAAEVPLLRRVLRQVLAAEQVVPGSHDHKAIVSVFNALPKGELFASAPADVRADIRTVLESARTEEVEVTVRVRPPRTAVLVVLPRGRYASATRARIREALAATLGGTLLEDHLVMDEVERAVLYFAFSGARDVSAAALQEQAAGLVRTWEDQLGQLLLARHGAAEGARLTARFAAAFPDDYRATTTPERAVADVAALADVERDGAARVAVYGEEGRPTTSLRFHLPGAPLVLSEFMPVLDNLGLRALAEDQVVVRPAAGAPLAVQVFHVTDRQGRPLDADAVGPRLADALLALRAGRAENDALNALVVAAGLDWRAVHALRAYVGHAVQAGVGARPVVRAALAEHPAPARLLFECFSARLRPGADQDVAAVRERFLASLDAVQTVREDRILRALLDTVFATVRTNFFARSPETDRIALKLRSADLPHLPLPRPLYEIWVHAPGAEGIHLRAGRIARGDIRYSDRPDDFRTEVLGLMKTQSVKNAVIVPTGAKGGFVTKPAGVRPAEAAVRTAYETFIRGLLDVTDNLVGGAVVHPAGLVVHDEPDPYLVVAADKGTATFSDTANALAAERGFWLDDAFASGGSHGYDHKALGITARGAWECVRQHFREAGVDADTAPLAVAGIGDMGGDVFGNGLLRSPHVRLRAAFNHLHVLLDPDPDPAASYAERRRLFTAGRGWDSYDPSVLSRGGAVVPRAAKRVTVPPEAQAMLGLASPTASGEELVRAVLGLDADLLFNGGIGTYVAATGESDAEVRDAANDAVRVRASALRAKVVAEGGNLGVTQRARVEYALAGGRIDTDAVDNSAGVDLSDHEVNLKVCLAGVEGLSREARNALLAEVTEPVCARVLAHNRAQARLLGVEQLRSRTRLADFRDLIAELERTAGLDRTLEALPDSDALRARRGTLPGLTRPELAVLAAYTKLGLQHALLASPLPDDPFFAPILTGYFPPAVAERHAAAVRGHALRREIVATELANGLVDQVGATFALRLVRDTGAGTADVVRAWAIAWELTGGARLAAGVEGTPWELEVTCRLALERTCERAAKWLLANVAPERPAADVVAELGAAVAPVRARLPEWLVGAEAEAFARLRSELEIAGLPSDRARELAEAEWLTGALDVATVAREAGVTPEEAAARYYRLGQHLDFAWLWARLAGADEDDRWRRRAAEGLVDDLLQARRRLAARALRVGDATAETLGAIGDLVRDLRGVPRPSLAALAVVVREIRRVAEREAGQWR